MKIQNLINERSLLIESQMIYSRRILKESCDGLTADQRRVVEGIYRDLKPLIEASLSTDQIQGIFGNVEKAATAAGGNRTVLGKGVDVAKKADETINKIGRWLQNTTPVKNFDQKFEDLKAKTAEKFPNLANKVSQMGEWAKANPGKTAAIIGVLTTIAGLAGGPIGGAIAGQILRGSAELLKGEKLSTAIGKGIKTAAYGAIAGWLLDGLGDWLEGLRAEQVPFDKVPGLAQIDVGLTKSLSAPGMEFEQTIHSILVPADQVEGFRAMVDVARGGDVNAFNDIASFMERFDVKEYLATKEFTDASVKALALENDAFLQTMKSANDLIRAAAQGAIAGKLDSSQVKVDGEPIGQGGEQPAKKESVYLQTRPLSEGQVYLIFNRIAKQDLMEGPMDWIKKKAGNLTTKITADKLNSAWQKAGAPTDSDQLADFLEKQGIGADIVKQVYADMKLPAPGSGAQQAEFEKVKAMVQKLPLDRKVRLLKSLMGGAKGIKQQAAIDADRERLLPQAAEDIK